MTNDDVFDAWFAAHARAWEARRALQRARWRVKGAVTVGLVSIVGTIGAEVLALQAAGGSSTPLSGLGPYVVPIVGVIAAYSSFRTAFSEHRRRTEAEIVSVRADLEKKVAHEVLDAHLTAIRTDVGELKRGVAEVHDRITDVAVSIGKLQGRAS